MWRGAFGVMTESPHRAMHHHPGMRKPKHLQESLKIMCCWGGVNLSPSLLEDTRRRRDTDGEMWPLSPFSKALRLFPKQHCVTRAAEACFMSSRSRVQTGQLIAVVISGGSGGCNLCQATWRFGLDWSASAPDTQWALLDTMGPPHTRIYKETLI